MNCFRRALVSCLTFPVLASAQNPFQPPRATMHYAPDRTFDLIDISADIDVDYAGKTITGTAVNTLAPLRDGLAAITLDAGKGLSIKSVTVDGAAVKFEHTEDKLKITIPGLQKGKQIKVTIKYSAVNAKGTGFGSGGGGWHWINPNATSPDRVGFWTQGESGYNSEWVPTWDYPNDLATSETRTTVPASWNVIGNGELVSTKTSADGKKKTFDWKMSLPHATYLLAIYGGPFDIKKDKWQDVDLWYVVPKGSGYLIDDSFGNTKDMLTFFSKTVGVKYPWNKYAQCAMYDFGGGMENVSATILGEGSLTESRDGYYEMDSLNSHEMGHQWFGDLVTCKDWGDTWLNESFATFMQFIYFEHSRGKDAYSREVDQAMSEYAQEARRYKRPISTKLYSDADGMFDSHSYPKGGVILHTLRRYLGDAAFFAGLKDYLTKWKHTPVESAQLRRSMTESSGINCEPFWAQWIEKPGHPVLDYTWKLDGKNIVLTVKQTQDTSDGTPIYDLNTDVAIFKGSSVKMTKVHFNQKEQNFTIPVDGAVDAVVFDPNHDFLREIPTLHWAESEWPTIFEFAPNATDRVTALRLMLRSEKALDLRRISAVLAKDSGISPAFENFVPLVNKADVSLKDFWLSELNHKDFGRRAQAVNALGKYPADASLTSKIRALVTEKAPIQVVINAITVLGNWDAKANRDVIEKAAKIADRRGRIKRTADRLLK